MMHLTKHILLGFSLSLAAFFASCGGSSAPQKDNTSTQTINNLTGTIKVVADESFRQVIDQEIKVFDSSYPNIKIQISYLPEVACLQNFFNKDAEVALIARDFTPQESSSLTSRQIENHTFPVAMDALAVIGNKDNKDTLLAPGQLMDIVAGKFARPYTIVYDNKEGSVIRYVADSLLKGQPINAQSLTAGDSKKVIEYVSTHPNTIGLLGVSHVYDPTQNDDPGVFLSSIRVIPLLNDSTQRFYKPYQAYIALGLYPLRRRLYFAMKDNKSEAANAFANFFNGERGQMIIKTSHLVPMTVPLNIRSVNISN